MKGKLQTVLHKSGPIRFGACCCQDLLMQKSIKTAGGPKWHVTP